MVLCLLMPIGRLRAQELTPNAYSPAPTGANLLILTDNFSSGSISLDPSVPITDVHANINTTILGYGRTLGVYGHYTNIGIAVPYVQGEVSGLIGGVPQSVNRTAIGDPRLRVAIDVYGAPALTPREFASYRPHTIVGLSLVVAPPLGAYDSTKLLNIGSNRWSFKPEVAVSQTRGPWTFEADVAAIFFTDNRNFYNGGERTQEPIGTLQLHAIYSFRPRLWLAIDGTYYTGGRTTVNGKENFDLQQNSRLGITLATPCGRAQSLKFAYSHGARTTIGGNFDTVGISYQYLWFAHR
jgi:hypothetical protein